MLRSGQGRHKRSGGTATRSRRQNGETTRKPRGQVRLDSIYPAPENKRLYGPVLPDDPDVLALGESIRTNGLREPLVISRDRFVLSGHRRLVALQLLGRKTARCRFENVSCANNQARFLVLLREHNRHRVKDRSTVLREEVISADPADPYLALITHRCDKAEIAWPPMDLGPVKRRDGFDDWRAPFINAVIQVVYDLQEYWPISDRRVHYLLLNDPPCGVQRGNKKAPYRNHPDDYARLTDVLTRLRIAGDVAFEAIGDETRPTTTWINWDNPGAFIREQLDEFLKGYCRSHMQSQTNHFEIIAEKNTIYPVVRPVAQRYGIPVMSGRGFASLAPRHDIFERYKQSGAEKLVLLSVTDFDADGEQIAQSFARSMRDDFDICGCDIHAVKVALTREQVTYFELPAGNPAKKKSPNYAAFVAKYGDQVWDPSYVHPETKEKGAYMTWELEALPPEMLQRLLAATIDQVIDLGAFNCELTADREDCKFLDGVRSKVHDALADVDFGGDEE